MAVSNLQPFIAKLSSGTELSPDETVSCLDALQAETEEDAIADLLTAWHEKGSTAAEIHALAQRMRDRAVKVPSVHRSFVDVVGTGGSTVKTFNISTAAAFVIAGAGVPVAKHGNRAATSDSGSADVLTELGVQINQTSGQAEKCLNEAGICFMFAPKFHSLSPLLGKVRRRLGFPTIFNSIGPLCNPAGAPHQLIGVSDLALLSNTAASLFRLGTSRSWVVHGLDGLDEISINGPTAVAEVSSDGVETFEISPADFGLTTNISDILPRMSPVESADIIRKIIGGRCEMDSAVNLVLINAAAAIFLGGKVTSLPDAVHLARMSIQTGAAERTLCELVRLSNI